MRAQVVVPVVLRAVLPNPTGSDSQEWIDLENVSAATVAAQLVVLADTEGSVTRYQLEVDLQPNELRRLTATQSGITLNNSKEQVELWWNGEWQASSPVMTDADEDQVWVQLDGGWTVLNLADYEERRAYRRWQEGVDSPDEATAEVSSPGVTPRASPKSQTAVNADSRISQFDAEPAVEEAAAASTSAVPYHTLRFPELLPTQVASASAETVPNISALRPPRPDSEEVDRYQWWKRRAVGGSLLMLWGGATLSLLSWPPLWRWWLIHGY